MKHQHNEKDVLILPQGQGRRYNCGTMTAIFKADENETNTRYSVSEWWLEPHSKGSGPHLHKENEEIFYVLEGRATFLIGEKWIHLDKGSFLRIPCDTIHDFENRTEKKLGILNFYIPGGFENNMPTIVKWFEDQQKENIRDSQ